MTIGNDILPGIITDIESIPSVRISGISNANVAIVGDGDAENGEAEPNEPYTITRPTVVNSLFGNGTPLARQVMDALSEGAMPVYAVMTDEEDIEEDLGNIGSTEGTLEYAPAVEDEELITFESDGDELELIVTHDKPKDHEVENNGVVVNPVTGDYKFGETPTDGTVEYVSLDYEGALEGLESEEADVIDAIGTIAENSEVSKMVESTVNSMEKFHQFAIGIVGAGTSIDTSEYESEFDNSRMAVSYPTRNVDGESVIGSMLGVLGKLGLNGSIMNKRLSRHSRLFERIDQAEQEKLVAQNVIPIASETQGALIVDDITSVDDDNLEESEMDTTFNRLVVDHVTTIVRITEGPFIGRLNSASTRGALQALITDQLDFLEDQNSILDYDIEVQARDANSAYVDVSVETVSPLRNIYNTVAAGQIE